MNVEFDIVQQAVGQLRPVVLRKIVGNSSVISSGIGLADGLVDGLVESQQRILILIRENPRISKRGMADSIGISTTAIDKNIIALKDKGLLQRIGSDNAGYWALLEDARE